MSRQPLLHDLHATVSAPTQLWTDRDGQASRGAEGLFHAETRVLSHLELLVAGTRPEPVACGARGAGLNEAVYVTRAIDAPGPDPTSWLRRTARVRPGELDLTLTLECSTPGPVSGQMELVLGTDLAPLAEVKRGLAAPLVEFEIDDDGARLEHGSLAVVIRAPGASLSSDDERGLHVVWDVTVTPGEPQHHTLQVRMADTSAVVTAPENATPEWAVPRVEADDVRLPRLVERSLQDLATLRMSWERTPHEVFLAAGAPWFFTLFGRDSIWAARMMLPLGTDLARGTLRTLAAGQAVRSDLATAAQPGKILHEVRSATFDAGDGTSLPPVYYGTVDATALWVCLMHDAWRWGMSDADVVGLLDPLERALAWIRDFGDNDGDGFLDYVDSTGTGLSNQGWKDSGDSVQWRDGTLAEGPIALSEVQAYAYEAAMGGAALLEAFGREGAAEWRAWAEDLAARFREHFWTSDEHGPYLGIALDRNGRLVDSVASNMGHVIGTGILSTEEERLVAERLVTPEMSSGYGLRTLSNAMAGYWPLGYHRGSVWAHDTAIAVHGLTRAGHDCAAATLARGLIDAAESFDFQMPELFGGEPTGTAPGVVPYPASCHPQAWSAASSVVLVASALGLEPGDDGTLTARGCAAKPVGRLTVEGLVCGGREWRATTDNDGVATVSEVRAGD